MFSSYKQDKLNMEEIRERLPLELGVLLTRYVDPFVGSGKMYYEIMNNYGMEEGVICDENPEIINVYKQVKRNPDKIIQDLSELEYKFNSGSWQERTELYKTYLGKYNYMKNSTGEKFSLHKAISLIFLHETHMIFKNNYEDILTPDYSPVPAEICKAEHIYKLSKNLNSTKILSGDFKECLSYINKNSFLFVNRPSDYINISELRSFNKIAGYKGAEIMVYTS